LNTTGCNAAIGLPVVFWYQRAFTKGSPQCTVIFNNFILGLPAIVNDCVACNSVSLLHLAFRETKCLQKVFKFAFKPASFVSGRQEIVKIILVRGKRAGRQAGRLAKDLHHLPKDASSVFNSF